jgi:predicted dehydrogenase
MRRSEPGVLEVKRRIDQGTIAGPIKGVAWYTKGLLHNGSHLINLCEFWLGKATGFTIISKGASLGEYDATPDVSIHFKVGSVLFLANQEGKYSHHAIELLASNGYLRYDRSGHTINWNPIAAESNPQDQKSLLVASESINSKMFRYQSLVLENLAVHMSDMPAHLCSGLQALETHGFIDKILRVRNEH